jgi:ATP-binding cassette subfamily B protein
MDFDFEHVENSKTNEMLSDIEAKINGNGLGIPQLYWTFPVLVQRFIGIVVSCILLAGMFVSSGTCVKSFFTSPLSTAALCMLIILAMIFTFSLRQREQVGPRLSFRTLP